MDKQLLIEQIQAIQDDKLLLQIEELLQSAAQVRWENETEINKAIQIGLDQANSGKLINHDTVMQTLSQI